MHEIIYLVGLVVVVMFILGLSAYADFQELIMVDVVATPARTGTSYVEWGPVFAGALAASAISFVLLTAGASIGLSLISPYEHESYTRTAASVAVFWSVAVPILAFLVGGYIAGRMRTAWADATAMRFNFVMPCTGCSCGRSAS